MCHEKDDLIRELRNFKSTIEKYLFIRHSINKDNKKSGKSRTDELGKCKKLQEELQILYGKLEYIIIAISGKTIGDLPFEKALSTVTLIDTAHGSQNILETIDIIPVLIGKVELLSDNQCRKLINKSDEEILIPAQLKPLTVISSSLKEICAPLFLHSDTTTTGIEENEFV